MRVLTFEEMQKRSVFFIIKPSKMIYTFILTFFILICALLSILCFKKFEDTVKAEGIIQTESPVSLIKCINSGKVVKKNFSENQMVQVNDVLFEIDVSTLKKELESNKEKLHEIELQIFENNCLLKTIENNEIPAMSNEDDIYIKCNNYLLQKEQYEILVEEKESLYQREKDLPNDLYTPINVLDLERNYKKSIVEYNIWKNNFILSVKEDYKNLQKTKDTVEQQILICEKQIQESVIVSPINGKILELKKFNIGDYLFTGEEILKIVPTNNTNLYAEIYILSTEVGKIESGNQVKLKIKGASTSDYRFINSKVNSISAYTKTVDNQNYYVLNCPLEINYVIGKGDIKTLLISGMTVDARIVAKTNTGLGMIIEKLRK